MRQETPVGAVVAGLESLRTPDGGYAKAPGGSAGTYHTFLAALCYDLLGRAAPGADEIAAFIRSRRRNDGGFAELAQMPHSSVNPTAAAAALLAATGDFDEILLDDVADFLTGVQRPDGGWPASGIDLVPLRQFFLDAHKICGFAQLADNSPEELIGRRMKMILLKLSQCQRPSGRTLKSTGNHCLFGFDHGRQWS